MNVSELVRDDTPTTIHNITYNDFVWSYKDYDELSHTVNIKPGDSITVPEWAAKMLIKHIIDAYLHERGKSVLSPEDRYTIELMVRNGPPQPLNLPRNIIQLDKK